MKSNDATPSLRTTLKQGPNESKAQLSKDNIAKRQRLKREAVSCTHKNKFQAELTKLKQSGGLKYLPKLCVDSAFMVRRINFTDAYIEDDHRWTHRFTLKEEYMRRDQVKQIDKFMKNLKVVYDYNERSPNYADSNLNYIEEKRLVPVKEGSNDHLNSRFKSQGIRRNIMSTGLPRSDKIYTSLNPYYVIQDESDDTLVFESRFESGNLRRAVKVDDYEYDLFLRNDYNSQGYTQWYYFSMTNVKANIKYCFNIKNFFKPDSLYNQGMKPLVYSTKKAENEGIGWYRGGEDI